MHKELNVASGGVISRGGAYKQNKNVSNGKIKLI